jgi:hypothetical protein
MNRRDYVGSAQTRHERKRAQRSDPMLILGVQVVHARPAVASWPPCVCRLRPTKSSMLYRAPARQTSVPKRAGRSRVPSRNMLRCGVVAVLAHRQADIAGISSPLLGDAQNGLTDLFANRVFRKRFARELMTQVCAMAPTRCTWRDKEPPRGSFPCQPTLSRAAKSSRP